MAKDRELQTFGLADGTAIVSGARSCRRRSRFVLSGGAVVAIWNGVAAARRDEFYDWHNREHMPERVGIPGFRRGRRFVAARPGTTPEWFTLYEADSLDVLRGPAYLDRLNSPTPWTRAVTADFRDTSRVIARVAESAGLGMGGVVLILRLDAPAGVADALAQLVRSAAAAARVTGAYLFLGDAAASGVVTVESARRTDLLPPPASVLMVEACDAAALEHLLPDAVIHASGAVGVVARGVYRLEYGLA